MNDADVAASMARTFLVEHAGELSALESAAIGRYLVSREREVARLRRTIGATVARRRRASRSGGRSGGSSPGCSSVERAASAPRCASRGRGRAGGRARHGPAWSTGEDRALAHARLRDPDARRRRSARGWRRRSPRRPAGSAPGRVDAVALGGGRRRAPRRGSPGSRRSARAVSIRSAIAAGRTLTQVRCRAADGDDLGRRSASGRRRAPRPPRRASPRSRSAVGGSCVTNRSVSRADPSRRPAARGRWTGSTTQNSELPPPTSTTSVSCVTGRPSVTPMIVR